MFSREILSLLNTPSDVFDMAVEYLNIYFLGLPLLFMYNVLSSMFNALGKSRIPLYFLIFSSVFNVILDWILVTQFDMGVSGVAWATLIAQGNIRRTVLHRSYGSIQKACPGQGKAPLTSASLFQWQKYLCRRFCSSPRCP